jgi:hypothetical protein
MYLFPKVFQSRADHSRFLSRDLARFIVCHLPSVYKFDIPVLISMADPPHRHLPSYHSFSTAANNKKRTFGGNKHESIIAHPHG